ncbi:MAG: DUF4124 domain-containing protein [Pseudomonas sp.]
MKLAAIALFFLPAWAQAQVYKCVAADGSTSYATVPCPAGSGETTRIIEPVPPSGVLNVPMLEQPNEEPPADATQNSGPSVSGVTVIEDSEEPRREEKRTLMREEAEQHKRDLYDNTLERREQIEREMHYRP